MALVGVLSLTLAAAPLPAMAEEGGSASDENATQTVTVYHFEMVYYDDPTFEDWGVPELTGLRLIGTSTVEGLKPAMSFGRGIRWAPIRASPFSTAGRAS